MSIKNAFKPAKAPKGNGAGSVGYDNARENIDPHIKSKAIDVKEIYADFLKGRIDLLLKALDGDLTLDAENKIKALKSLYCGSDLIFEGGTYEGTLEWDGSNATWVFKSNKASADDDVFFDFQDNEGSSLIKAKLNSKKYGQIMLNDASNSKIGCPDLDPDYFAFINDYTELWLGIEADKTIYINYYVGDNIQIGTSTNRQAMDCFVTDFNLKFPDNDLIFDNDELAVKLSSDLLIHYQNTIYFRDADIKIESNSDGELTLCADEELRVVAPRVFFAIDKTQDVGLKFDIDEENKKIVITGTDGFKTINPFPILEFDLNDSSGDVQECLRPDTDDKIDIGDNANSLKWKDGYFKGVLDAEGGFAVNGSAGWTGTFTNGDGNTVTVEKGIITDVS